MRSIDPPVHVIAFGHQGTEGFIGDGAIPHPAGRFASQAHPGRVAPLAVHRVQRTLINHKFAVPARGR